MANIRIYYQDDDLIVIEKPAGFQIHTPIEYAMAGGVVRKNNVSIMLRKQLDCEIFTVHRLDRATSGVMMFSRSSAFARALQEKFSARQMNKTYVCFVRGWADDYGTIEQPLSKNLDDGPMVEAITHYKTIHRFELPYPIGKYERVRYSLVEVHPVTGRIHQIRRHFRHISHPLVGDSIHGDGKHNHLWRELLKTSGGAQNYLFLKAHTLSFEDPRTGKIMSFQSVWSKTWHRLFNVIGFCPTLTASPSK